MINFPGDVWTGLAREANSQEFAWSDRSVKEYTHWSRGQPGQPGSKRTCVQASNAANNDGRWMEVDCNKKNGFMCRIYKGNVQMLMKTDTVDVETLCFSKLVRVKAPA